MLELLVEALSLIRIRPLSFLGFMFVGGGLLVAGIAIYLYSLVSVTSPPESCKRSVALLILMTMSPARPRRRVRTFRSCAGE